MILRHPCAAPGCRAAALSLSEPARCIRHVESPEDWYEQFEHRLAGASMSDEERDSERFMARQDFNSLVHHNEVSASLYREWYQRIEPSGERRFKIGELSTFCLLAAAAGIIGNAAYDALKALVRRLGRSEEQAFETMVTPETYEEIRRGQHGNEPALLELSEGMSMLVRRRYWIVVRAGERTNDDRTAT